MQQRSRHILGAIPLLLVLGACSNTETLSDNEGFTVTHLDSMQVTDGLTPFGVPLGGISGIDYDDATGRYWAISDDRAEKGPARFYTLELTLGPDGRFATDAPVVTEMTPIADQGGEPYPKKGVDPESIRRVHDSTDIVYTSEGDASKLIAPLVRRATAQGEFVRDYALPSQYLPAADASGVQVTGVRNNLALEGLTFSPDGSKIIAVTENSLVQDGQIPSPTNGTDSRVIMFDSAGGDVVDEYIYAVEPISGTYPDMVSPTGFTLKADRGVTEILAVDNNEYLVIERGAVPGKGSEVQIYWASTEGATTVIGKEKLDGTETPMRKKLLFDFSDTGANPDNVEGITWGPTLSDGTRTLVLSADDNFNPEGGQHTMFHVLAVK